MNGCISDLVRFHVERNAEHNPDAIAILAPGRKPLTYAGLHCHVAEVVEALQALGIGRNDRIAMVLPEGPEAAVASITIASGATCAPLNPAYRASEYDFHLADLKCRALLVLKGGNSAAVGAAHARGIPLIELAPVAEAEAGLFTLHGPRLAATNPQTGFAHPADIAFALHTSGTAARPKLVPLTHRNVCASASNIREAVELSARDRCLNVMPLFHIHGLSTILVSLAAGASVICPPGFSVEQFFEWTEELRPTWYSAAPAIHQAILDAAPQYPAIVANSGLRFIRSASAAIPQHLIAGLERVFKVPFINAYGMTEASPQIASNRFSGERRIGSVGRAAGPDVAIMDEAGRRLPPGETGEVAIQGENVIEAYEQDAEANQSAFVAGWLRTGDLGHLDQDGYLYITGRLKEIINRGGEKISPREVDEVLLSHPAVAQAAVFAIPHPTLGEGVAAAIVTRRNAPVTEAEIRNFAAARLAYFKVPQQVVIVEEIPKGSTGKLERVRLAWTLGLTEPASNDVEDKVIGIWATVLRIQRPGIRDNFFQLGGDSLTAAQVVARLRHEFQIELPMETVFEKPTVAELAELVSADLPARANPLRHPLGRNRPELLPLSFAQERLWFLQQMEPTSAAYNICCSLWLNGRLNETALERSLDEIRRRHEILRTTFQVSGERPVQAISPAQSTRLAIADAASEAEALQLAREEAERPFAIARGPLFRATLVRLSPEKHALLLTAHHIVSDGWSTTLLYRELSVLYAAFCAGQESPLPELTVQYADFAVWQRDWLRGGALDTQLAYWTEQLRPLPPLLDLPLDRPRPPIQTQRGARKRFEIRRDVVEKLKALGVREDATLFMTLMAAFQTLLYRYTGQDSFVVGTPIANRTQLETEQLIGFFANTLALRADMSGNPLFGELLARVRVIAKGAYAHQDLPFDKLVDELRPERDPSRTPLFQVMFAFQNLPGGGAPPYSEARPFEFAPDLGAQPFKVDSGASKFDLTLYLWETPQGLAGAWQYNADLFKSDTIDRLAKHFETLLGEISRNPDQRIAELGLVAEAERLQIEGWNQTAAPHILNHCFHQLFEEQAARTPDRIALECGGTRLTYGELNGRANQVARHLRRLGVQPETLVGIALPRSTDMVVTLLGVLKAGGAYLPLDPDYPAERLRFVLEDSRAGFLVTETRLVSILAPQPPVTVVCFDAIRESIAEQDLANLDSGAAAGSLAYVIYTSGSTGKPKGVMVTHANMCHCARAMREATQIDASDRYLHTASFAFSSSVRQLVVPLSCGATSVVALPEQIRDPHELFALIRRTRVSVLDIVPSYWRTCLQEWTGVPESVRLILSASELLTPDLPREWTSRFDDRVRLMNMYGQTETTGIVAMYPIPALNADSHTIPVGRPIANTRLCILDALRNAVPVGVVGELYVGGAGVAKGYLHHPDLTAEKFVGDLYRTGDRARYLPDGNIEFIGRADDQLKIRGFRIEPQEVEAALRQHPWVWESAVVVQQNPVGHQWLAAFVVAKERVQPERLTAELREFLKGRLPDYMVPSAIADVESLPLTANRKIDRKALSARAIQETNGAVQPRTKTFAVPRTSAEKILVDVWKTVLHNDRVSIDDNFFDLGGDSLLSVGMISRANQAGVAVSLKQLFQHQTIAELAGVAELAGAAEIPPHPFKEHESAQGIRVTLDSLRAWGREALAHAGLPPEGAAIVTEVQIEASLRGQPTHNVDSIPRYARRILAGAMNPVPNIRVEHETGISAQMDGDNGPGQWVATVAMENAIRKAREKGVGLVSVRRSNHFGAAGQYVWMAAQQGLIGLCTTNGPVILAPTGGVTPTFGNNPLGVGIPAGSHYPILLDIAMSVAPRGKIGLQLAEGKPLPPGWILDRLGKPSIDPADLAAGLGVPIGGHKGYGLALVLEALAGALPGAGFCTDHRREQMRNHSEPRDLGHFFMAIDPELFSPLAEFTARVDRMIEITKAGERGENVEEILIPGEAELRERERNLKEGVPVRPVTYRALLNYAEAAKLKNKLVVVR